MNVHVVICSSLSCLARVRKVTLPRDSMGDMNVCEECGKMFEHDGPGKCCDDCWDKIWSTTNDLLEQVIGGKGRGKMGMMMKGDGKGGSDEVIVLAFQNPESVDQLLAPGNGPIMTMSVEYDHTRRGFVWEGCEEQGFDPGPSMLNALRDGLVKKVKKFKTTMDGPWLYDIEAMPGHELPWINSSLFSAVRNRGANSSNAATNATSSSSTSRSRSRRATSLPAYSRVRQPMHGRLQSFV